jgi:hypothetical protein
LEIVLAFGGVFSTQSPALAFLFLQRASSDIVAPLLALLAPVTRHQLTSRRQALFNNFIDEFVQILVVQISKLGFLTRLRAATILWIPFHN